MKNAKNKVVVVTGIEPVSSRPQRLVLTTILHNLIDGSDYAITHYTCQTAVLIMLFESHLLSMS